MIKRNVFWVACATLLLSVGLVAQGSLSSQVLQLLTRANAWTATNTFLDLRVSTGIPSTTTNRFYTDGITLYWNGAAVTGPGGATIPHNLLSTAHPDTNATAVLRGMLVVGNSTPAWTGLTLGASGSVLRSNGTDAVWSTDGSGLTALNTAALTGAAIPYAKLSLTTSIVNGDIGAAAAIAYSKLALTASVVNADIASGAAIVYSKLSLGASILNSDINAAAAIAYSKLALTNSIVNADISSGAAIVYSKLSLTGGLVNTDINAAAAIAYSKLALTGSVVNGDLTNATLLFAKWASNSCTNLQVPQYNGSSWVCKTLLSTDISGGVGTVASVGLSLPAIFTVSNSPVTTTGTLTATLATQTANLVWAGPASGAAAAPTFRVLANADLPITGVSAATYPKVTVNTAGVVMAGSSTIDLTADVANALPRANGGTGVILSGANTVLVGSGSAWVPQTLPDCVAKILSYTQSTSLFACTTFAHNLLSAIHGDTVTASPVRGDLIVANTTPAWTKLAKGTAGQFLQMGSAATDPGWGNAVSGLTATTAGAGTLGSVANPFASLILGTAATNTLTVTPAAFAAGVVATVDDPGITTAKVPLVKRGTIVYTAGSLTTGTCSAAVTATVTGLAATAVVTASLNAAPGTQWQKGIYFLTYPTTNTVNIVVCNPTAGSITPDTSTFNFSVTVP